MSDTPTVSTTQRMPRWRKRAITAVVIGFVCLHLPTYVTGHYHWPFTTFPMFSWKMSSRENGKAMFECELAYGIPADPSRPELRLKPRMTGISHANDFAYTWMLRYPYRGSAYDRLSKGCPDDSVDATRACASQRMIREALQTVFRRYEKRRGKERPPLAGVRLYRVRYAFDPENVTFEEAGRTLLGEWLRSGEPNP